MNAVPPITTAEGLSRSIAEQLKQAIYAGEYKAGDRLMAPTPHTGDGV